MNNWKEYTEFIPKNEIPAASPKEIAVKYYILWPDEPKEITPDNCQEILKNLRNGQWENIYLSNDPELEENFMLLESGNGLFALEYVRDNSGMIGEEAAYFSTYDPEYLDSDEETDIQCSDGQSIICRKYTTTDKDAVITAIEYFIHTGKLWDGIPWMKNWQEAVHQYRGLINLSQDDEAAVWIATSKDIPGLVLESNSFDTLLKRVRIANPELLMLNTPDIKSVSLQKLNQGILQTQF